MNIRNLAQWAIRESVAQSSKGALAACATAYEAVSKARQTAKLLIN